MDAPPVIPAESIIDSHCHLTTYSDEELETVIEDAAAWGVTRIVSIGASEGTASAARSLAIAERFENVWSTVGIHPHDAGKGWSLSEIESLAAEPRVVAIGETGLDFFRDWSPFDAQERLFHEHIELAVSVGKPLIIHCREALEETISILESSAARNVGGVFHCYAGDEEYAKRLARINFLVSFPGTVTFKKAQTVHAAASAIPLSQMLVETDTPYLSPEPRRGKQNHPKHTLFIAMKIAELKGATLDEVARQTSANAAALFRL
ncbi:MAG: TatD family hydrolase [Bdellovibrionales bacterium]|nr:TatD family hydrolase [Bdellovibrionales bacterium]